MDKDDSGYVNIILKTPNNNILYVENNISSDSGTLNLEQLSVGELVRGYEEKMISDDKLVVLLKLMISSGENQNGEKYVLYNYKDEQNKDVFNKVVYQNGKVEYKIFFEGKDEIKEEIVNEDGETRVSYGRNITEEQLKEDDKIYLSPMNNNARYIKFSEISNYEIFSNNTQLLEEINNLVDALGTNSIFIKNNDYQVLYKYEYNYYEGKDDDEDNRTIYTSIGTAVYEWNSFKLPKYYVNNKSLSTSVDSYEDFDFIPAQNSKNSFVYQVNDDLSFSIILNSNSHSSYSEINVSYNKVESYSENLKIVVDSTITPYSIVLRNDISLNSSGFNQNENINIIGNKYYISYIDDSLFNNVGGKENKFIKDLSLLSETYDNTSFISGKVDYLNLKNISLYGSIVNYVTSNNKATIINNSSGTVQSENGSSVEYNNNIKIDGIDIYMAINNTNNQTGENNVSSDLILFNEIKSLIKGENYGIIKSVNGENGNVGENGNSSHRTGDDGTGGTAGGSIYIVLSSNKMSKLQFSDHGLLITGNGGNGGAGGASFKVDDILGKDNLDYENKNNMQEQFAPGNGGEKGYKGKIYGLSEEVKENIVSTTQITECPISNDGIDGMMGVTGRGSLGSVRIQYVFAWAGFSNPYNEEFVQYIQPDGETGFYAEGPSTGKSEFENLLNAIFDLGDYSQKGPAERRETDEEG